MSTHRRYYSLQLIEFFRDLVWNACDLSHSFSAFAYRANSFRFELWQMLWLRPLRADAFC